MSGTGEPPTSLLWSLRTYVLLGSGTIFLLMAAALRSSVPIFLALPLLMAPLAAALTGPHRSIVADLIWHASGSGPDVRVSGTLRSPSDIDFGDVSLAFSRPADLVEVSAPTVQRTRASVAFALHWRARHPTVATVPAPSVTWQDPIGLVERRVEGQRPSLTFERYPPDLLRLRSVRLERTLLLPGETRSRRIGAAGEFFGIREAVADDPLRRINWRATARLGRRMANEFELDRTGDLLVLVDTRSTLLGRDVDEALLGVSRAAAIGIAEAFLRQKARVGYAAFGEFVDAVPMAGGRGHRLRVDAAIRATRRAEIAGPSDRCATTLGRFYPPGVTTILISSLQGQAEPHLVVHLRRRGYPSIVLSPSPLTVREPSSPLTGEREELAQRLERIERRRRLARLSSHTRIVDWSDFWSLGEFARTLRQPGRRSIA